MSGPQCQPGQPCGPACPPAQDGHAAPCGPNGGATCGPAPQGGAQPQPCGPPPPACTPEKPCAPPKPAFCETAEDGTLTCPPPPNCEGKSDGACAPPSWCQPTPDGKFACKPPEPKAGEMRAGAGPCGPAPEQQLQASSTDAPMPPPQPCAPPAFQPACNPGADGQLVCAPPPECGGAAFGGAGAAGCAPPDFCKANAQGAFECKPPEDCRRGPDGRERCVGPPVGVACEKALKEQAAAGNFVPCAPPPTAFCPPPPPGTPPGQGPGCRAPPPPPRFCAPGEAQFPPNHPTGTPPACILPPKVENGQYKPPAAAFQPGECQVPPPGQWPPPFPPENGKVWCPPAGFAPPPQKPEDFQAFKDFTKEKAPPQFVGFINQLGEKWANFDEAQLSELNKAGAIHQILAPPSFDGRFVNGTFMQSQLDENLGIKDFSVGGATFFKDARPAHNASADFSTAAGPAVIASGGGVVVETHNVPSGILAYKSTDDKEFNVSFTPDEGYEVTEEDGLLVMTKGDWKGILVGEAEVGEDGGIDLAVDAENPAFFMAVPPTGLEAESRLDIAKGIHEGKVFGEVSLVERNGTAAQDLTLYEDASVFTVDVTNTSEDVMELEISGEGEGQAVVFTVDRASLTTPLSDFNVTIDGELMVECGSFEELTESAETGGCFHMVANESAIRVSVMPEHFSTHKIAFGSVGVTPDSTAASSSPDTATDTEETAETDAGADAANDAATSGADAGATPTPAATPAAGEANTPGVGVLGMLLVAALVVAVGEVVKRRRGLR